jgi:hypothetical protein
VVDGVPKLIMISAAVGGDHLPSCVSYCILTSGPEGWSLVSAKHIGSAEDLHDCLILFSARARNSLDSELWWSGDIDVVQQILSLPMGIRASFPKVLISSASKEYILQHLHLQPCCPPSSFSLFSSSL